MTSSAWNELLLNDVPPGPLLFAIPLYWSSPRRSGAQERPNVKPPKLGEK